MRGVITLVFDDGYTAIYEQVVPLLDKLGLPGVFALPLDTARFQATASEPVQPWQNWLAVKARGHEIAAHGVTHTDLRQLSLAALDRELREPKEKLGATTFVYPGGAVNEPVKTNASQYYTAARTTQYGFESLPPADPWNLSTVDYTRRNFSSFKANLRTAWAALGKRWLIETYHMVYPATGEVDNHVHSMHHSVSLTELEKHLLFIKKLPVAVKTIHDVISHSHN